MAAHNENISHNRRRLFKALSTAPVVATLSPGEVLARESSYQCTTKEMPEATIKFHKSDPGCMSIDNPAPGQISGAGCHAYEQRSFWDPAITATLPGDNCFFWNDKFVVETSRGVYYVVIAPPPGTTGESGGEISRSSVPAADSFTLESGAMFFWGADGDDPNAEPCAIVDMNTGLFLAIGEPVLNNDGQPINWKSNGVWPELDPADPQTAGQGALAGSCLTSFPNATGFFLADS